MTTLPAPRGTRPFPGAKGIELYCPTCGSQTWHFDIDTTIKNAVAQFQRGPCHCVWPTCQAPGVVLLKEYK